MENFFTQFLDMFADIVLYPMSIEVNNLQENPITIIAVASLLGIGFISILRGLLCRI